jgi:NADPH:quinone reductase
MKEAVVAKGPKVSIVDSPIPKPGPHQIVTKVVYSGSNPKDWKVAGSCPTSHYHANGSLANRKRPEFMAGKPPVNQGDDISGIVHEVGEGVHEFKPGDRVMAFHEMMAPGGSYAEYALSWNNTTALLPPDVSFEG